MFQLDDDDKSSSVDTTRDVMEASSTQGFPRYKKPLPAISTGDDDDDGDVMTMRVIVIMVIMMMVMMMVM